ncbi:MAG: hypothetical protein J6J23_05735 [Clostridia bacterium]|nr:hypothetical protein [Clostridia bacterium]
MVKEARLQINISYDLENKIKSTADTLGMSKNEFVKFAVQNYILAMAQTENAIKSVATEYARKENIID